MKGTRTARQTVLLCKTGPLRKAVALRSFKMEDTVMMRCSTLSCLC